VAVLSEPHKEAIVVQLARFRRPAEVVAFMRDEHELELTVQQVRTYDPTNPRFEADRDKWEPIFAAAREAYIADMKQVTVANQAFRLNELHDLYGKAKASKNYKLAAELLEQIARECGGVLTNRRELDVSDSRRARDMSTDDRRALLGSIIAEELARQSALPADQKPQPVTKH
jgi:hypothetical protein